MVNSYYLRLEDVMEKIEFALRTNQPFSLVRVGDGENLVLAQEKVMKIQHVLKEPWAIKANQGQKGVKLPNLSLRELLIEAVRKASVVGVLPHHDSIIQAPDHLKRKLTDQIFSYYKISPTFTCHACINRELVKRKEFWQLLRNKKVLIIYQDAEQLKRILENSPYHLNISLTISFSHYGQMTPTLRALKDNKAYFDVALICCGVNAVVLAHKVAELTGKVGIDFGKASNILIRGRAN